MEKAVQEIKGSMSRSLCVVTPPLIFKGLFGFLHFLHPRSLDYIYKYKYL